MSGILFLQSDQGRDLSYFANTPAARESVDLLQRNHDPCLRLRTTHRYLKRNIARAETGGDRQVQLVKTGPGQSSE